MTATSLAGTQQAKVGVEPKNSPIMASTYALSTAVYAKLCLNSLSSTGLGLERQTNDAIQAKNVIIEQITKDGLIHFRGIFGKMKDFLLTVLFDDLSGRLDTVSFRFSTRKHFARPKTTMTFATFGRQKSQVLA